MTSPDLQFKGKGIRSEGREQGTEEKRKRGRKGWRRGGRGRRRGITHYFRPKSCTVSYSVTGSIRRKKKKIRDQQPKFVAQHHMPFKLVYYLRCRKASCLSRQSLYPPMSVCQHSWSQGLVLSRWQTNDKIGRFYRPILSADFLGEIRTSSTAKFIAKISANKIRQWNRSCDIQKSANFLSSDKTADFIVRRSLALCRTSHFYPNVTTLCRT